MGGSFARRKAAAQDDARAGKNQHQVAELRLPTHLKDQLRRSSSSIVLNLAEGSGRTSPGDQVRFFHIAMGSCRETQAGLDLCPASASAAVETADQLGGHLYRLIQSFSRR